MLLTCSHLQRSMERLVTEANEATVVTEASVEDELSDGSASDPIGSRSINKRIF